MSGKIAKACLLPFLVLLTVPSIAKYSGGTGEPNDPYLIATPNDLNSIGLDANDWYKHFLMIADINMAGITGTQFNVIGDHPDFTGVFDGNNHAITNFTYEAISESGGFLIGDVSGQTAAIKNVIMINADVNEPGDGPVACLVGRLREGQVSNCHIINGKVNAENFSGLLVGINESQIVDCSSSGTCYAMERVGGLVGETREQGTIVNSYSDANVTTGTGLAGGLVGDHHGDLIINCYSTGTIEGLGFSGEIGGLVGENYGVIERCYSSAEVIGGNDEGVGGLVGVNSGEIKKCFATGSVLGVIDVGGLVGYNFSDGNISDSYSIADVNETCCYAGGLVSGNSGTIRRCWSAGLVRSGGLAGGLVSHSNENVEDCFWDTETSDCNVSDGGTGLSTNQMQMRSTFADAGWDFIDTWDICNGTNYPKLAWQIPIAGDFGCPDGVDLVDYSILAGFWQRETLEQDYNSDGFITFHDWAYFANTWDGDYSKLFEFVDHWLTQTAAFVDIAPAPCDDIVDWKDLIVLCQNWLKE